VRTKRFTLDLASEAGRHAMAIKPSGLSFVLKRIESADV
jgi:hypothetical protein